MSAAKASLITGVGPGLVARHRDFIEQLVGEISGAGGKALVAAADVGRLEEMKSAVARVRKKLGKINLLLHNASASTAPACLGRHWKNSKPSGGWRR